MATGGEEQAGYSLVKDMTIKLENANETPRYNSIVICQDKIIVVDKTNDDKVKIHRLHDGKFLGMLDSDSAPCAICLMDATTICVLHRDGLIEMASIKSEDMSPVFTRMKKFRLHGVFDSYHSVVKVHDNIVVVGVKQDTTYWCIASLDDGHVDTIHQICKWSFWSYVTTKDNIIYISCFADVDDVDNGVYGFDILNPSQCKYTYKHERLQCPTSIVINEDGNIFVGNYLDPCIHQLTASCELVAIFSLLEIPGALHAIFSPVEIPGALCPICYRIPYLQAMFWDNGRLYVASWYSHDITVFRHVYQEGIRHKYSEILMSHEKKQPIIVETSKEIEQGNVDKGQSNVKTAVPPSGQRPMDSENGKQDQNPEEDTRCIEFISESNFWKISLLHKIGFFFSKSIIIRDIKKYGYNKCIRCLLRRMCNLLRKQIPGAIRVWSGYRTQDLHTPVFVVMLSKKTIIPEKLKFSEPYDQYEIVFRNEHTPNDEEERISKLSKVHENTVDEKNAAYVVDCIRKNTERLMNEHINLSIIAASTVKAMGFSGCLSKGELKESMCIVLYVPIKGIIPVGEKEFPKDIDGISTDVREGEFVFHNQIEANMWHSKLQMGCRIATKDDWFGTLGGFVDLPGGKSCCITAAHVVLNEQQRKMAMDNTFSDEDIEIYQPTPDYRAFGKVLKIAFAEGNESASTVDAALIEITDHGRTPSTGLFPFDNYPVNGFTTENPMMYNSGKTRDHSDISIEPMVVKYGCTTRITCGKLEIIQGSVRFLDTGAKSCNTSEDYDVSYPKYFRQMVVRPSDTNIKFSDKGDSGALVFMYHTTNRDLEAIGLLIGGSTHEGPAQFNIVTPIQAVFQNLGLQNAMFKCFSDINEGEENLGMNELIYSRQSPEIRHEISDTKINEPK